MELMSSMSWAQLHPLSALSCSPTTGSARVILAAEHCPAHDSGCASAGEWDQTPLPLPWLLGECYGDKTAVPSTWAQEPAPARTGTVVASGVRFGAK